MKSLIIDQIEITKNGTVQVRMHKFSSDGDLLGNHRTLITPVGDVDAQIAAVNAHMSTEGFSSVSDSDVARLKTICNVAWTEAVVSAYQAAQAERATA